MLRCCLSLLAALKSLLLNEASQGHQKPHRQYVQDGGAMLSMAAMLYRSCCLLRGAHLVLSHLMQETHLSQSIILHKACEGVILSSAVQSDRGPLGNLHEACRLVCQVKGQQW